MGLPPKLGLCLQIPTSGTPERCISLAVQPRFRFPSKQLTVRRLSSRRLASRSCEKPTRSTLGSCWRQQGHLVANGGERNYDLSFEGHGDPWHLSEKRHLHNTRVTSQAAGVC